MSDHHELEVNPVSIWFSRWFSIGHRVKYAYLFGDGSRISVETNGTVFNELDLNAEGGKLDGVFPKLNQSQIYFETPRIIHRTKNSPGYKRPMAGLKMFRIFRHCS